MASVFKKGYTTRSGRKVKPTPKVQAAMTASLYKLIIDLSTQLDHAEAELVRGMRKKKHPKVLDALFSVWSEVRGAFREASQEYGDVASDRDWRSSEGFLEKVCAQIDETDAQYAAYNASTKKVVKQNIDKETEQLQLRIQKIEEQISRASLEHSKASGASRREFPEWKQAVKEAAEVKPEPAKAVERLNPHSAEFVPKAASSPIRTGGIPNALDRSVSDSPGGRSSSSMEVLDRLADLLSSKKEHLPKMEPEVFSGDLLKFPIWLKSFESLIEKHTMSNSERLFYLGKYTSGAAKEAISGFLGLFADDAYTRAKTLLTSRYGDKIKVAQAYREKLFSWSSIKKGDHVGMQRFADFLWQCQAAMESVGHLESLNSAEENAKLMNVVPQYIAEKWYRVIDRWYYDDAEKADDYGRAVESGVYPPFREFCKLVSKEARILNGPGCGLRQAAKEVDAGGTKNSASKASSSDRHNKKAHTFASSADVSAEKSEGSAKRKAGGGDRERRAKPPPKCFLCQELHFLSQCDKFLDLPVAERKEYASTQHLCFGCLGRGHSFRDCRIKIADLFSENPRRETPAKKATSLKTSAEISKRDSKWKETYFSMIVPIEVRHASRPGKMVKMFGLLDTQSDSTFIAEDVLCELSPEVDDVFIELVTMGSTATVSSKLVRNLEVKGLFEQEFLRVGECYSREAIPGNRDQIPDPEAASRWKHLRSIVDKLVPKEDQLPIGMLIGHDCPAALLPREMLYVGDDQPVGIKTKLGWSLMGAKGRSEAVYDNRCFSSSAKVVHASDIAQAFDLDFAEVKNPEVKMSQEDQVFLAKVKDTLHVREDGHFEMDLPFRREDPELPNNRDVAERRLAGIKKKMDRDPGFKKMYTAFMQALIDDGFAEVAPKESRPGKIQYMPHHAVTHPRKPGEVRGVFDGAAEKHGKSLNKALLSGPDLTNNLVGVVCNFRRERVAVMCDVKKMFLQVGVSEHHRDYLRYLWYPDGDTSREAVEYRMKAHLFGATSSPGCVNYAFKELANMYEEEFGTEIAEFIRSHFYVDDGLVSVETVEEAVELCKKSHEMCKKKGFYLCKYLSNVTEVMEQIPEKLLAKGVSEWMMNPGAEAIETSLGITWDRVADVFLFLVREFQKKLSRRGLLSSLSSVYDPIGFIAPVILVGRLILQELCRNSVSWDEPLSEEYISRWTVWYRQLMDLKTVKIPRCLREKTIEKIERVEMHHFSDASTIGYGSCSYVKLVDAGGNVDVNLIMAKARVGPKKAVTMPRMELQAAVLTTRVAAFLKAEMKYPEVEHHFWSDSKVVLGYIANAGRRFHLYVSNRVQQIIEVSDARSWRYVSTSENPADIASRGASVVELRDSRLWWKGPEFLTADERESSEEVYTVSDSDPEVKQDARVSLKTQMRQITLLNAMAGFSSWYRLCRSVLIWKKFIRYLKLKAEAVKSKMVLEILKAPATVADLEAVRELIVKTVQQAAFQEELQILQQVPGYPEHRDEVRKRRAVCKQSSNLYKLDVYLDARGMMRVGGRYRRAYLPVEVSNPIVLPRKHFVTKLLIRHAHVRTHHGGRQMTLAAVRSTGYWVIHSRAAVDEVVNSCVTCKRLKAAPMTQKMADVPEGRVSEEPPFTYCGMDLFGPVNVKEGRAIKKRWICLFTCFASRASHLEPVHQLTTSSFINALRRLINRRGNVRHLYSDQGTNFVGAAAELKKCMAEMDQASVQVELAKMGCDWVKFNFIPPAASHMGGLWERMVKSAKSVFLQLLHVHGEYLTDELLNTLTTEIEATLNNRPITCVDVTDPWSEPPLTPARLLTLKTGIPASPPGSFPSQDVYSRHTWRRAQAVAEQFWRQWRVEFLPDLQIRKKWNNCQYNLRKNDVVVVVDKELKRNQWPLAIVEEVMPSADGLVRRARVRTETSVLERPIAKLVYLCSHETQDSPSRSQPERSERSNLPSRVK